MHNCKATRRVLVEATLNRGPSDQNQALAIELEQCAACREEYVSMRNTLRVTDQAIQFALPAESFWPEYEARLRRRLERDAQTFKHASPLRASKSWLWLRKLAKTSVPVPVPLASALSVFIILSIFFTIHAQRSSNAVPAVAPPSVVTKTVEVPVVREKTVTRVVYRRVPGDLRALSSQPSPATSKTIIDQRKEFRVPAAAGLAGFKPANEAKLTIIKGSYRDEK